jgi:hypothetical protein
MVDGLGGEVWNGSLALCDYCEGLILTGRRVAELGCGAGLCGIVCAFRGADCILTDEFPDLAALNASSVAAETSAAGGSVSALELQWGEDQGERLGVFDYVLGAELSSYRKEHEALAHTCRSLAHTHTEVLFTFDGDVRQGGHRSFESLGAAMTREGFVGECVRVCELERKGFGDALRCTVSEHTSIVKFTLWRGGL